MEKEKNKLYGTTQTKEMLDFVFALVKGIDKSLEDGKIDFTDVMNIIPAMSKMGLAFKDMKEIPKELADLDKEEADDLKVYVSEKFDIANDKVEFYIEKAFELLLSIFVLVQGVIKK